MVNHPNRRGIRPPHILEAEHAGFNIIKHAVAEQFKVMQGHTLYRTTVDKDALWDAYLGSFPEGSNPVFRKRTEHDCSCCRGFIRTVGSAVAIIEGKLVSIWDVDTKSAVYQPVADALSRLVKSHPIDNILLHTEAGVGQDRNYEQDTAAGAVREWTHFHVVLSNARVCRGVDIGPCQSEARATHDVLLRGLREIKIEAIETVMAMINQNALYRGTDHKHALDRFGAARLGFGDVPSENQDLFAWGMTEVLPPAAARIRNTSIGTLLVDLSEGMDEDAAVRKFEAMVAPANYRRSTALVTPGMIAKAKITLDELGLTSALERRYATLTDISINDILFVDRNIRMVLKTGVEQVFAELPVRAPKKTQKGDDLAEIPIESFLRDVVPTAGEIEVKFEARHIGNLVSLVAPTDAQAPKLFTWDNGFSWSYNGDFADSVKERVKQAGGNVTGDVCCRLAWYNFDDLDLHMKEPRGGHIYFSNKFSTSTHGELDVDMNAGGPRTRKPVENIVYPLADRMMPGTYVLYVNQYAKRDSTYVGFEVEIDIKGAITRFRYERGVHQSENVPVAHLISDGKGNVKIEPILPVAGIDAAVSRRVWGLDTEAFHRVNVAMLSPNFWAGSGVGNKHYFFMLNGAKNEGTARGFYNEFLRGDLNQHRKVLEMVGARMRTDEREGPQLSGLGFSQTQRADIVVRVKDKTGGSGRLLKVVF